MIHAFGFNYYHYPQKTFSPKRCLILVLICGLILGQSQKASLPILVTLFGIVILSRNELYEHLLLIDYQYSTLQTAKK